MIGGTMSSKFSIAAVVAGGFLMSTAMTANAADLGGDCCADLEERVAVLEATTARKGNRKVSLTVYGHVNTAIVFWDNGVEDDVYAGLDNDHRSTRIGFKGKAKINSDLSAGYKIEVQFEAASSAEVTEDNDDGKAANEEISIRKSYLYIKSKTFGAVSLGRNSVATDDITHDSFVSKTTDHIRPDWHYNRQFTIIGTGEDLGEFCGSAMSDSDACFDIGSRRDGIRYDTPTFAGFKLSAAWGEDDFWDVALRYAGEFGDIKIKAGVGYSEWDSNGAGDEESAADGEKSWAASGGILHSPTGIFVQGSYRNIEVEVVGSDIPEADVYYLQGGIKQKWNSLGATAIWGEYAQGDDGWFTANAEEAGVTYNSTELSRWGVGLTQWVDAAKMQLYLIYQHTELDAVDGAGLAVDTEDFDSVIAGGSIRF